MTQNRTKILYIVLVCISFTFATMTILCSFYFSDSLQHVVKSVLALKVYPPLIGGPVAHTVYDPMNDDTGDGSLVYPLNRQFPAGNFDLVSYTVREPVFHAPWQAVPEYWQLELEFRTGFDEQSETLRTRTIYIYLNIPGFEEGSVSTLYKRSELVRFSSEYPWHYALAIIGDAGMIYDQNGNRVDELAVLYSNDGKRVYIKVPLVKKELQRFYTVDSMYHYVLVSGFSPLDSGGVLPVSRRKTRTTGGGARSRLTPRVYDLLSEGSQQEMLSSWSDTTFSLASIEPIEIPMRKSANPVIELDQEKIANLETERNKIAEKLRAKNESRLNDLLTFKTTTIPQKEEIALLAFNLGETLLAEQVFTELLLEDSENPSWLAYRGSLETMKGDGAMVVAAVEAVQNGYHYLDEAVQRTNGTIELARTGDADSRDVNHRLAALLNRGGVSKAVPNNVFIKALQGAQDYLEAAELFHLLGNTVSSANCCFLAATCFELDGKTREAAIWKREAARLVRELLVSGVDTLDEADRMLLLDQQIALMKEGLL